MTFDPTQQQQHERTREAIRAEFEDLLSVATAQHAIDHDWISRMRANIEQREAERRAEDADRRKVRRRAAWAIIVALLTGSGGIAAFIQWDKLPAALAVLMGA